MWFICEPVGVEGGGEKMAEGRWKEERTWSDGIAFWAVAYSLFLAWLRCPNRSPAEASGRALCMHG